MKDFPQSHEADFPIDHNAPFLYYDVEYKYQELIKKTTVRKYYSKFIYDKGYQEFMDNENSVISIKLIGCGY